MNNNAFFCFLLVLAFVSLQAGFAKQELEAGTSVNAAKALAFEAEKASFVRSCIESSADALVGESLLQGLALNLEPVEIKELVNRKLLLLFKETEKAYDGKARVMFFSSNGSLDAGFMNRNSAVSVERLGQKTIVAEYVFTAGLMRNNLVLAEIDAGKTRVLFQLPAGYTVKAGAKR